MAGLDTIKYIIEALRSKAGPSPGVDRTPGYLPRRNNGGMDPVAAAGKDAGYMKYVRMQEAMGEAPVSLEEWLSSR